MKKKGLKYYVSFICTCCAIVYLLLRIFGILDNQFHFKTYKAFAADTTTSTTPALNINTDMPTPEIEHRVLSYEETIGLYGNRIQLKYTGLDEIDRYFQLELVGSWDTPRSWPTLSSDLQLWHVPGESGSHWGNLNVLWWYPSFPPSNSSIYSDIEYSDYLIYEAYFPIPFESSSSIAHPNIEFTIDFPEGITVNAFRNNILFLRHQNALDSGWSVVRTYGSKTFSSVQMMPASNGTGKGQSVVTPFPQMVDNETGITLGVIPYYQGDLNSMTGNPFTISQQVYRLNGCDTLPTTVGSHFIVYIQRPEIISNITWPTPPPTTRPPETTRADFTTYNFTYDLSPLETNQINQIRLQNEQLQVELAQLNGINYICRKLDAIYEEMVERGEIPVNLIHANTLPRDSDIEAFIQGQTTYTLAQLPPDDYFDKADTLTDLIREFTDRYSWFYIIGMFSLALGVACWIIFKGRG